MIVRLARLLFLSLVGAGCALSVRAQTAAEIITLTGRGDYRSAASAEWVPARVRQGLEAGTFVRTVQLESKMGLLLADQTQLTLQGVSVAQIKAPEASAPRRSIVDFGKGKGRFQTKTPTRDFNVRTPTGMAAIRGTEWLVEVDDDGRSTFTVVEGAIDISNEHGSLTVDANEQGVLEMGKAPSKRRLQNARERVQWVSAFTIDPGRYAELRAPTDESKRLEPALAALKSVELTRARELLVAGLAGEGDVVAAYLLLADIEIYFGRADEAVAWLHKARARFPGDGRIGGLLANAYLFADDFPAARAAAAAAAASHPDALESHLAAGAVARLDGDYPGALRALRRATEIAPGDWRAWHALGQLDAARADSRRARAALQRADQLLPGNAPVLGELGLLEANSYDLPRARAILARSLELRPDDFATWSGLGIARLKSGDVDGAIDALLRATLLEPRYAAAHVYLAAAYWQQGRTRDAFAELRTASLHDPKDPLPYQLAAMMESDLLRPGEALAAARESVARLPYVKSLDPIANDLRGSSNLGFPLAQLGLEAWALKNAHDSFDPMWAGSHLFLADRLPGRFAANSELIQGFLTDPLAFGASNRFQTLVPRQGHYGTIAWRGARSSEASLVEPQASLNGSIGEGRVAYFLDGARVRTWLDDGSVRESASSYSAGLGVRPREDLGLFLFANRLSPDVRAGAPGDSFDTPFQFIDGRLERVDAGVHYRHGPDWQLWIKGGHGSEDSSLVSRAINRTATARFFRDSDFTTQPRRDDLGARSLHRFLNGLEVWAAAEASRFRSVDFLERDAFGRSSPQSTRRLESVLQDIRDESRSYSAGARWRRSAELVAELGIDRGTYRKTNAILVRRDFANQLVPLTDDHDRERWSPNAGLVVKPMAGVTLRAAHQDWLRPASTASLKPSSTAGIALDDRYVLAGGRFTRDRGQVEWEASPSVLVVAHADRQKIENLYSPLIGVLNNRPDTSNLERLRNRSFNALTSLEFLEGFPELSRGKLSESGVAVNALATRRISLFAEAIRATSENTGVQYPGRRLAFLPKWRSSVGGTYFSERRWFVIAQALHRGERFSDEGNTGRLEAEWSGALQAYWETLDKRWSVEAIVSNIGARSAKESLGVAVVYRF